MKQYNSEKDKGRKRQHIYFTNYFKFILFVNTKLTFINKASR